MTGSGTSGDADPRDLLAAARARTVARIDGLARQLDRLFAEVEIDPPDDEHDPEGAGIAFERQQTAALLARARADLAELDAAAARLAQGTYGVCEACGAAIPAERLDARPAARTCVGCAAT